MQTGLAAKADRWRPDLDWELSPKPWSEQPIRMDT